MIENTTGIDDTLVAMLSALGRAGPAGIHTRDRFSFETLTILLRVTTTPEEKFREVRELFLTTMDMVRIHPDYQDVDTRHQNAVDELLIRLRTNPTPLPDLYAGKL